MANQDHLETIKLGVVAWNNWRRHNPGIRPMLSEASLDEQHLAGADLDSADLFKANLKNADLSGANLRKAHLREADLTGATLTACNLRGAHFRDAYLTGASVANADLSFATLVMAHLRGANLTGSVVYGVSAWDVDADETTVQTGLVISKPGESVVTVDNLEVAQFISLLLHNERIRAAFDTIGKKAVLILGRFTPDRMPVLDAVRNELRRLHYVPMVFDFERPTDKDFTETILTLAGMCRFIVADVTNPRSSPLELQALVPNYMIPLVPLIQKGEVPFSMFRDLRAKYDWVLDVLEYDSAAHLVSDFEAAVVEPALKKHDQLVARKTEQLKTRHIGDY